jgi:hypothetical protein
MQHPIVRRFLGILCGLVLFFIITLAAEYVMGVIHPMPAGVDASNKESLSAYTLTLPISAYLLLIAGYWVGSFVAGYASVFIAKSSLLPAIVLGVGLLVGCILNFKNIPHPMWVMIASCVGAPLFAWFGGRKALHAFLRNQ